MIMIDILNNVILILHLHEIDTRIKLSLIKWIKNI